MSDQADFDDGDMPQKKFSGKKVLLFVLLPLLLLIGGGAFLYFSDILGGGQQEAAAEELADEMKKEELIYYDSIPPILVNLQSENRGASFLKVKVVLQVGSDQDIATLEEVMPRVLDNFQVYLRELRLADLQGSAGMYRLRQELLLRVTAAAYPAEIKDVLFQEILIQ